LCCPVLTASGPTSSNSLSESWTPAPPWMMHIYNSVCYAVQYLVFVDTTKGSPSCLYLSTADDAARVMGLTCCDNSLIQQLLEWGNALGKILYFIYGWVRPRILQMLWGTMEDKEDHECQILGLQVLFNLTNKVTVPTKE
jgi:hypothetical protein